MDAMISNRKFQLDTPTLSLWIACMSIVMMFSALASAYIVRQAAGNWYEFELPSLFYVSTAVLLLSSLSLHLSFLSFKRKKEFLYKFLIVLSLVLGVFFVFAQYYAWQQMFDMGVDMKLNPSGAFVYVISGLHAAHVLGGITCLIVATVHAFALPFKIKMKRIKRFRLVVHYWHFVDFLWVLILLFFIFQK